MRAFGPGSVSSLLKAVLDVLFFALAAAGALLAVALVLTLLAQPFLNSAGFAERFGELQRFLRHGPGLLLLLVATGVWLFALGVVVERLRRLFSTMIEGRPFRPQNTERLRVIGLALIGLQLASYVLPMLAAPVLDRPVPPLRVDAASWFPILVVFVLAEVFREGARLQAEAELTV